eukprot:3788752-Rhodomonas_salina.1
MMWCRSIWIVVFLLFVGIPAVAPNFAETEISFDFPSEGSRTARPKPVVFSLSSYAFAERYPFLTEVMPRPGGHIVMLLNGGEAGRFDMHPNEYGEVDSVLLYKTAVRWGILTGCMLPDGEYTAAVKLVNEQGADLVNSATCQLLYAMPGADHEYCATSLSIFTTTSGFQSARRKRKRVTARIQTWCGACSTAMECPVLTSQMLLPGLRVPHRADASV